MSRTSSQTPPLCTHDHQRWGAVASRRRSVAKCSTRADGQTSQPQDWNTWCISSTPCSATSAMMGNENHAGVAATDHGLCRADSARRCASQALPSQLSISRYDCSALVKTGIH